MAVKQQDEKTNVLKKAFNRTDRKQVILVNYSVGTVVLFYRWETEVFRGKVT